jgi:hypothetical protein
VGTRPDLEERVPAAPFVEWVNREVDALDEDGVTVFAARCGVTTRTLYRWSRSLDANSDPTDNYARSIVEDTLDHADVPFADIYPEIAAAEDVPLEPDAFCGSCHEVVTPIGGDCPWCGRATTKDLPRRRMYCKRDDRMVWPTAENTCWRCGGTLTPNRPRAACKCGCGTMVNRFDEHGRGPVNYVRGHAPRSLERKLMLPAGPFVEYLREELDRVDPLTAVASKHAVKRDDLVALLRGDRTEVERTEVTHALWTASRYGQPKGAPRRSGQTGLYDLYPELAAKHRCPECGGRKSPRAEVCKPCKSRRRHRGETTLEDLHLSEVIVQEAKRLRFEEWLPMMQVAERLLGRTPHSTVGSLRASLVMAFRVKRWPTGALPQRPLPNDAMLAARRRREEAGLSFKSLAVEFASLRPELSADQLGHVLSREFGNRGWFTGRLDRGPERQVVAA